MHRTPACIATLSAAGVLSAAQWQRPGAAAGVHAVGCPGLAPIRVMQGPQAADSSSGRQQQQQQQASLCANVGAAYALEKAIPVAPGDAVVS